MFQKANFMYIEFSASPNVHIGSVSGWEPPFHGVPPPLLGLVVWPHVAVPVSLPIGQEQV